MVCEHCYFSCTAFGDNMSDSVFEKALSLAQAWQNRIVIGGGEPTLHPSFFDYLNSAMKISKDPVAVVTNGTKIAVTMTLLDMAEAGLIKCAVSIDKWHPDISKIVRDRALALGFTKDVGDSLVGPARNSALKVEPFHCSCPHVFITPLGDITPCGCKITKVGNISSVFELDPKYYPEICERAFL